ncbi:helix-turn-helix domain-containing protein [Lapidilactobacillus achengensis]|uniref:Helix-turn-helix domain-containing protein n=1 Tax=Lapidilactobacillus achengensis TaxID=2486000 RepID=A0ABW1UT77_9LACO|nr:AraC family transcriptional regulator [Lapidilactobacillus achengensis]
MRVVFTQINAHLPLYLESIGYDWHQETVMRAHGYGYYHWLQTTRGQGICHVGGQTLTLTPGDAILLGPAIPHDYWAAEANQWDTQYLTFGGPAVGAILGQNLVDYQIFRRTAPALRHFIADYGPQVTTTTDPNELSLLIYRFLLLLKQTRESGQQLKRQYAAILQATKQYLDQNYQQNLTNQELAQHSGFSSQHLNRLFKQAYHVTPLQYLNDLRLRNAQTLLLSQPQLTVEQIAIQTGFSSASYFIAQFHQQLQMTPRQFRRLH